MRSTRFDLPREELIQKLHKIVDGELTPLQKWTLWEYHQGNKTLEQIARQRGVGKTTVWRTLKRAEANIKRVMEY